MSCTAAVKHSRFWCLRNPRLCERKMIAARRAFVCSCPFAMADFESAHMFRILFLLFAAVLNCSAAAPAADENKALPRSTIPATAAPVDQLIPWLLNEDRQLRGIPF